MQKNEVGPLTQNNWGPISNLMPMSLSSSNLISLNFNPIDYKIRNWLCLHVCYVYLREKWIESALKKSG